MEGEDELDLGEEIEETEELSSPTAAKPDVPKIEKPRIMKVVKKKILKEVNWEA